MRNKSNLLILGAYGQENIGDEALLKSTLDNLDRNKFKDIFVNSMDPEKTSKLFGVKGFYTGFIHTIIPFLKSKMIIYGGGTILVELRMTPYIKSLPLIRSFLINFFRSIIRKEGFLFRYWSRGSKFQTFKVANKKMYTLLHKVLCSRSKKSKSTFTICK